jgi:predicted site-specific integrase-resolvase
MKTKTEMQEDVTGEPLISQAKAAELCGVTRAAIQELVRRGRLNSIEAEGRKLIYYKEVEAFAAEKAER